jgi:hypothetical protein
LKQNKDKIAAVVVMMEEEQGTKTKIEGRFNSLKIRKVIKIKLARQ